MLWFVLFIGSIGALEFQQNARIIGGKEAQLGQFPYQVALKIDGTFSTLFCGGTLINEQYVLTSANCIIKGVKATATIGAVDLEDPNRITIESSDIIPHDDYDSDYFLNDIGLVKLEKPIKEIAGLVEYVALPSSSSNKYENQRAKTAGWGLTSDGSTSSSTKLLYIESTVLGNRDCKKIDPFGAIVQESHVCLSGQGQVGSCSGDTGGPLVLDDGTQIGVFSFSYKSCMASKPSVFTRVGDHLEWIKENVQ